MNKKTTWIVLLIMAMTMLFAVLGAQEAAAEVTEEAASGSKNIAEFVFGSGMVKWFKDGGWAMWPILLVTIYGLAYVIWKFIALIHGKINLNNFLGRIVPLIKDKYKERKSWLPRLCPAAAMLHAGLVEADRGVDAVEKSMETSHDRDELS